MTKGKKALDWLLSDSTWIYVIGALGYLLYVTSSYLKTRTQMLSSEIVGCLLITLQWVWLGEFVPAGMNFAFVLVAILGLFIPRFKWAQHMYPLILPYSVAILLLFGGGSLISVMAFVACIPGLSARYFKNMAILRGLAMSGGFMWLVVNISLGVAAGALCNIFYITGHCLFFIKRYQEKQLIKTLSPA